MTKIYGLQDFRANFHTFASSVLEVLPWLTFVVKTFRFIENPRSFSLVHFLSFTVCIINNLLVVQNTECNFCIYICKLYPLKQ